MPSTIAPAIAGAVPWPLFAFCGHGTAAGWLVAGSGVGCVAALLAVAMGWAGWGAQSSRELGAQRPATR